VNPLSILRTLSSLSALLFICGAFSELQPTARAAVLLDRIVRVQPIRISNGVSTNNPNEIFFIAETKKVWAQAGIDVVFLPPVVYTNSVFFNISSGAVSASALQTLKNTPGAGQNPDPNVINIWFCNLIDGSQSILGFALQSALSLSLGFTVTETSIAIPSTIFTRNGTVAIAHEIGHSLGLDHSSLGAVGQTNLMSSTTMPPNGLADIFPDGAKFGQLTEAQIAQARSCVFPKAFPAQPVQISPPRLSVGLDPNGKFKLGIDVFTNGNYRVLTRTILPALGANWENLDVLSVATVTAHLDWIDTNSGQGLRFYQLRKE
jgi:hypothetical protein